ncbi:MAG: hypothetical protein CM15mP117_03680 [Alphaproteobacteria bacterium]|nr:MAG: hypothetical protein CM15mP117_03680 [Alphaproteobacteria bacterium]
MFHIGAEKSYWKGTPLYDPTKRCGGRHKIAREIWGFGGLVLKGGGPNIVINCGETPKGATVKKGWVPFLKVISISKS